jgi:sugar/nucleoside kinase (ribokinase family)
VIVVAGDRMVDVFVLPELRAEEQHVGLLLRSGGSAANTACWLASLGRPVAFVGRIGADGPGTMVRAELERAGVVPRLIVSTREETGCVAVEVTEMGERTMRSARGANAELAPDDIVAAADLSPECVHLTGYALLGPYGAAMLRTAGEVAGACGALLSFDPSSLGVIHRFGAAALCDAIGEAGVDFLLPNRDEALALAETTDVEAALRRLMGPSRTVVVKDGSRGSIVFDDRGRHEVRTVALVPVDTTGAGDAFNAGAIDARLSGAPPVEIARRGNEVAGRVIQQYGGRPVL